jgi:hypothetical protein
LEMRGAWPARGRNGDGAGKDGAQQQRRRRRVRRCPLSGYQIHLGRHPGADCGRPFAIVDGKPDGAVSGDGRVVGTYLHGLFASDAYRSRLLQSFGLTGGGTRNYRAGVEQALDEIAAELEAILTNAGSASLLSFQSRPTLRGAGGRALRCNGAACGLRSAGRRPFARPDC